MKIVLIVTDRRGKNIAFLTDALDALSFKKAIQLAQKGDIEGVHTVKGKTGTYLRSSPNAATWDNLDYLSLTYSTISKTVDDVLFANSYGT